MDEHAIEEAEVETVGNETKATAKVEMTFKEAYAWPKLRDYQHNLGHVCAHATTTAYLIRRKPSTYKYGGKTRECIKEYVLFLGDKVDVSVASAMFRILLKSCHDWVRLEIGPGYGKAQRSYCEGFVNALWIKVNRVKPDNGETTALVLHSKKDQIAQWMDEHVNKKDSDEFDKNRRQPTNDEEAQMAGFMRGLRQNIPERNSVE